MIMILLLVIVLIITCRDKRRKILDQGNDDYENDDNVKA